MSKLPSVEKGMIVKFKNSAGYCAVLVDDYDSKFPRHDTIEKIIMCNGSFGCVELSGTDAEIESDCSVVYDCKKDVDWNYIPINTKVLVKLCDNWKKRYFAGVVNGNPLVFRSGQDSWTSDGNTISYDVMILYTGNEGLIGE